MTSGTGKFRENILTQHVIHLFFIYFCLQQNVCQCANLHKTIIGYKLSNTAFKSITTFGKVQTVKNYTILWQFLSCQNKLHCTFNFYNFWIINTLRTLPPAPKHNYTWRRLFSRYSNHVHNNSFCVLTLYYCQNNKLGLVLGLAIYIKFNKNL